MGPFWTVNMVFPPWSACGMPPGELLRAKTSSFMETEVLWNWSLEELIRYRRSRVPLRLYLPLAVFLTIAAQLTGRQGTILTLLIDLALAGTMLFQFRLWDDLTDRERDRLEHPERVLVR